MTIGTVTKLLTTPTIKWINDGVSAVLIVCTTTMTKSAHLVSNVNLAKRCIQHGMVAGVGGFALA